MKLACMILKAMLLTDKTYCPSRLPVCLPHSGHFQQNTLAPCWVKQSPCPQKRSWSTERVDSMLNYAQGALCPGGPGKASLEGKESKLNPEVLARWTELEEYFMTPWTVACQGPLSMEFFRQEYWSGLPFPFPGESSWPRDWNWDSCIVDRFFTYWAMKEISINIRDRAKKIIIFKIPSM